MLDYFRSKKRLIAERDRSEERRKFLSGFICDLRDRNKYLEQQLNNCRIQLKDEKEAVRARDVLLNVVANLRPDLLKGK